MVAPESSARNSRLLIGAIALVALVIAAAWWLPGCRHSSPEDRGATTASAPRPPAIAHAADAPGAPTFQVATDAARAIRNPRDRSIAFAGAFRRWLEQDPSGATAYLRTLPRTSAEFTQALLIAVQSLAAHDPAAAVDLAAGLVTTREQRLAYNAIFAGWAKKDPAAAAAAIESVPANAGRENAVRAVAETWAQQDFDLAYAWAAQAPADCRTVALESVLSVLVDHDPVRAIQLARETLGDAARARVLTAAVQRLVATNPETAASVVGSLPAALQGNAALEVVQALAARDPAAAARWAGTLPDGEARTRALVRALEITAQQNSSMAEQLVGALPAGSAQQQAVAAVAWQLGRGDPGQGLTWAGSLPDPASRAAALARVADGWATRDAAAAAHWAATRGFDQLGGMAPATINAALSYWALKDPEAAGAFVQEMAPAQQGPAAAFLAPLLAQRDPAHAMAWAQSLTAPAARSEATAAAYQRWAENAPAAAQTWLATASLPADVKTTLRGAQH